ncbi:unnamed protein product [Allacma fusca]|uniref:Uncharacterized protein n=1 Tax=Allacma fusca TaxID=39272 RepID=A0A8J2KD26_9HEXA|nr:unnamed protein product [Allacma fusca]
MSFQAAPSTKSRMSFNLPQQSQPQYVTAKMLPRRKSIRAIFEPIHRNIMDSRKAAMGLGLISKKSFTSNGMKKRMNKAKPSIQILRNKRQSKYSIMSVKGLGSKSKSNFVIKNAHSRPKMRTEKSKSYQNVMPSIPMNWNQFASTISKRIENTWNNEGMQMTPHYSQDKPILMKYENQPQATAVEYPKSIFRKVPANTVVPTQRNPTVATMWKPGSLSSNSNMKTSRPEKLRTFSSAQSREQEFRSLYDRLRMHYTLQEETYKNMPTAEKLPLVIQNLVNFERELLEYLKGPNPHPEAKVVLKDLRGRRAETMSRLVASPSGRGKIPDIATITNPESLLHTFPTPKNQSLGSFRSDLENLNSEITGRKSDINTLNQASKLLEKQEIDLTSGRFNKGFSKRTFKKFLNKTNPKSPNDTNEFGLRKKDAVEGVVEVHKKLEKLAAYIQDQTPVVRTLQCKIPNHAQTSSKASTEAFQSKYQILSTKETMVESPVKKIKWNKSDFTRLLPHSGEIPKNASKVVAEPQCAKRENKALDSKTYMTWLEELMSQKLGQELSSNLNEATVSSKDKVKGASAMLPKWATIATKKEDPVAKFKRTYEGFQKYMSSLETASQNTTRNIHENVSNNNVVRSQVDPYLNKHVGFTPPQTLNKDLDSVSNTIRAIIANSKNRNIPEVKPNLSPAPQQKPLGIHFQDTTIATTSNISTNRKVPKMVFMNNTMDINTLMNPKTIDQPGQESQMVVPPGSTFHPVDALNTFRRNLYSTYNNGAPGLVNPRKNMGSVNNLLGEGVREGSKMNLQFPVPKIRAPWNTGFDLQQKSTRTNTLTRMTHLLPTTS